MRTHLPGNVRMLSVSVTAGMSKPCVARFHMGDVLLRLFSCGKWTASFERKKMEEAHV